MNKKNNKNINIFNFIPKKYGSYIVDKTREYQKQYGFDMGTGEHATWNNEADAFKHAYMQAQLSLLFGKYISKGLGNFHEYQGNISMGQSANEENMDLWNNNQGREIAKEIIEENGALATIPSEKINDIIAQKVMQRMKAGQLITNPDDKRKYNPKDNSTGFAAPTENEHIFSQEEIAKMSNEEFEKNEKEIMRQMEEGLIRQNNSNDVNFSNYTNPVTGEGKIYTKEDIKEMSDEEFDKLYKEISAQANSTIGIPARKDLEKAEQTGGVIYVKSYTRSDGTQVKGYFRSRKNI